MVRQQGSAHRLFARSIGGFPNCFRMFVDPEPKRFGPAQSGPASNPSLVLVPELVQLGGQVAFHFLVRLARAFTRRVAL